MTDALHGIHGWPLFIAAGLALNLTPGADMALIASRAAALGWRGGAAAALGVGAGCWVHTAAAALGVSALMAGSDLAFALLRWLGAAYLVWLGLAMWRSRPPATVGSAHLADAAAGAQPADTARSSAPGFARLFAQGFLTNALNPKVALFFLAFVPQFIDAGAPHKALALMALGTVFIVNGTLVNLALAWAVAATAQRIGHGPRAQRLGVWLNRGAGTLFVALGLRLALGGGSGLR